MDAGRLLLVAGLALWAGVGVLLAASPSAAALLPYLAWLPAFLVATAATPPVGVRQAALLAQIGCAALIVISGRSDGAALLCATAGQLPFLVSARAAALAVLAQTLLVVGVELASSGPGDAVVTGALYGGFQAFSLGAATLAIRERTAREAVLLMNAELLRARAELAEAERRGERLRIARDLHDAVGHHLTALGLQLELATREHPDAAPIKVARHLARQLLAEVRGTVQVLRDGPVDLDAGLRALTALPTPKVHVQRDRTPIDPLAAEVLLRCAQELVTNAARHAKAAEVWLTVAERDGRCVLAARDDGPGAPELREGNGLRGMRERLEAAGGQLRIGAGPGFPVEAWVPR